MSRLRPACAARSAAILLMLAVAVAAPAAADTAPANLLVNPDFESPLDGHPWLPAGWDTSETNLPTVFFGRDTFLVHSGRYAVNIANTSTLYPLWNNWSQAVLVGPEAWGKDLVFSVWTRSNGLQGRAYILAQAYRDTIGKMAKSWRVDRDAAGKRLGINKVDDPVLDLGWKRIYFSDPETEWVRREARVFVPPSTNVIYVRSGLLGTGQVIFDDASLTLAPALPAPPAPPGANLLADPGFEGDGNAWEYSMPPYEGLHVERDTTAARSGGASVLCYGGLDGFFQARVGVCQPISNRNLAGKRLRLSAHVKTDSLKGSAFLRLYAHTSGHGMVQSLPADPISGTNDWKLASVELDIPPDAWEVWAWFAYNAPSPGMVRFDDCALEVLGPAATPKSAVKPAAKPGSGKKPAH